MYEDFAARINIVNVDDSTTFVAKKQPDDNQALLCAQHFSTDGVDQLLNGTLLKNRVFE